MKVDNILTNQVDTASFEVFYETVDNTFQPTIGHIVQIQDGGVVVFEGPVVRIDENPTNFSSILYKIQCTDYTRFLDRRLVTNSYTNEKVEDIIQDIVDNFTTDGFTTTNVSAIFTADSINFNYEYPSDCFKQLADLTGYDWYVDENKDIHFFSQEINVAPFELTDTSANWDTTSLIIRNDNSQIKNQFIVRGGEFEGTKFTSVIDSTGVDTIYGLGYKYNEFAVTLTGQSLTIGIDQIDDEDLFDVMHNNEEKIIRFRDARKPTTGADIRVSGLPLLPVLVKISDAPAQAAIATAEGGTGVYEDIIIDNTITSKQAARDRAEAEIEKYKTTVIEGSFTSKTSGLKAGQILTVDIASRGINTTYIISKVQYKMWTPTQMQYNVSLISTKTYGIIEWMLSQIREGKKAIEINPDEVLDTIEAFAEGIAIAESITTGDRTLNTEEMTAADTFTAYIDSQPTWVAGEYKPSALNDRNRPGFSDLDNLLGS